MLIENSTKCMLVVGGAAADGAEMGTAVGLVAYLADCIVTGGVHPKFGYAGMVQGKRLLSRSRDAICYPIWMRLAIDEVAIV